MIADFLYKLLVFVVFCINLPAFLLRLIFGINADEETELDLIIDVVVYLLIIYIFF